MGVCVGESRGILCPNCRKLISSAEPTCPYCGAAKPGALGGAMRSLFWQDFSLTQAILSATIALFAVSLLLDPWAALDPSALSQGLFGLLQLGSPSMRALYLLGMTGGSAWVCGHWWTVLTATFLHGGLLHIFFNMSWLRVLGPTTSDLMGPARFVVLYLLTGVGGFVLSNLLDAPPTIGASCSIFGLMGALLIYGRRRGGSFGQSLSQQATAWAVAGFLISFAIPHVNNWGHIGGFLTGMALAAVAPLHQRHEGRGIQLLALVLILATVAGFGLSIWKMWTLYTTGMDLCV